MNFKKSQISLCISLGAATVVAGPVSYAKSAQPIVNEAVVHTTTRPLIQLAAAVNKDAKARLQIGKMDAISGEVSPKTSEVIQNFELPFVTSESQKHASSLDAYSNLSMLEPYMAAKNLQTDFGGDTMPSPLLSFDGVDNVNRVAPPDTVGDVGPNHYVQMVNVSFAVWDKLGNMLIEPTPTNALWDELGGICAANNDGDPIVLYDQFADRWMMSQFAINPSDYHECIAISKTSDPTGEWHLYDFKISEVKMNDYPHFGVWPDGYYMSVNQFYLDGREDQWGGAGAVAFERDKMLRGESARMIYFDDPHPVLGGMLPSDLDGMTPPPEGAPNYFLQPIDESQGYDSDEMHVWAFKADWENPENSTFEQVAAVPVTGMDFSSCSGGCIPQPGVSAENYLDKIPYRLMNRLAYRNFGDHESLVVNHTVYTPTETGAARWSPRWYEIRNPSTEAVLHQQGSYAPDGDSRWMGSVAMDAMGNMALGYTVSGENTYPSVRYTGRLASDPLNMMAQGEQEIVAGGSSQLGANGRWGDYSSMNIDPVDDCTFWYTQEYYGDTNPGGIDWRTRIGSFKFPNCTAGPTGTLKGHLYGSTGEPLAQAQISVGAMTTFTDESGYYEILAPVGEYDVAMVAYGYAQVDFSAINVVKDGAKVVDATLSELPKTTLVGRVVDGSGHAWPIPASLTLMGDLTKDVNFSNDSSTGEFSIEVYQGWPYAIKVASLGEGYVAQEVKVDTLQTNDLGEIALMVDSKACVAPGYQSLGIVEDFDGTAFPPAGWNVVNNASSDEIIWKTSTDWARPNYTGGSGHAAAIDNDRYGWGRYDSDLITPEIAVSDLNGVTSLQFKMDFVGGIYGGSMLDMDISLDGGAWNSVLSYGNTMREFRVDYDLAEHLVGAQSFRLRWRYHTIWDGEQFDNWAQVDDVTIAQSCASVEGGLVSGHVLDANTGEPVANAIVSTDKGRSTSTKADGSYLLFTDLGDVELAVKQAGYTLQSETLSVALNEVLEQDFTLNAGKLDVDTQTLELSVTSGRSLSTALNLANKGSDVLNFNIEEINAAPRQDMVGPAFAIGGRKFGPKDLWDLNTRDIRVPFIFPDAPKMNAELVQSWPIDLVATNGVAFDQSTGDLWLNNLGVFGGDDKIYRFKTDGTKTDQTMDVSPLLSTRGAHAGMAFNKRTGKLWQIIVGGDRCIYEFDTNSLSATGNRICPDLPSSQRGLAYDPNGDQFFSGSFIDGLVHRFASDGTLLESTDVGLPVAGLAFNPATNHLFVAANSFAPMDIDIYVLDVSDEYRVVGGYSVPGRADGGGSGISLDCDGNLWVLDIESQQMIQIKSGETGVCEFKEVDWLNSTPSKGQLALEQTQQVQIDVDAKDMEPGFYQAQLLMANDSPYLAQNVLVNLNVLERTPGELGFTVSQYRVNENEGSVTLTVSRQGGSDNALSVSYETLDATAVAGSDYQSASGQLHWQDLDDGDKEITIAVMNDGEKEQPESFSVRLHQVDGGATLSSQVLATVEIEDAKSKSSGGSSHPFVLMLLATLALFRRGHGRALKTNA
ncbi:carboxypeptidase regulatory-like domain-containing protein [Pseudoalteromonas sp. T1lg75]|uniref:carboxypeptidase regulatory-like domain-containing protein n=1 Tax=Pseudoalteromonas sp. T1lg75 TaxID=2077102 RepID=UPI00131A430D|nr:carboxypeptidase regulatory-like domain-containing protein [Pseudoalteromonas sp. T1lg75]